MRFDSKFVENVECQVCQSKISEVLTPSFHAFVSSDCTPIVTEAQFYECSHCGAIGKRLTDSWRSQVADLYERYEIYHQSDGEEQRAFSSSGVSASRSDVLVGRLLADVDVSRRGSILDVGCGNGAFLKAFNKVRPGWNVYGNDLGERNKEAIESVCENAEYINKDFRDIRGTFNIVSMVHCLEHLENPLDALTQIRSLIAEGGLLFIEVPDIERNPFDLLIYDHCNHFSKDVLFRLLTVAGFEDIEISTDWHGKELSVVARCGSKQVHQPFVTPPPNLVGGISWLSALLDQIRSIVEDGRQIGLFGTSIAAVWVQAEIGNSIGFFVDEDSSRVGRNLFGRPVLAPQDVQKTTPVLLPFPYIVAEKIAARFQGGMNIILPPEEPTS